METIYAAIITSIGIVLSAYITHMATLQKDQASYSARPREESEPTSSKNTNSHFLTFLIFLVFTFGMIGSLNWYTNKEYQERYDRVCNYISRYVDPNDTVFSSNNIERSASSMDWFANVADDCYVEP